MGLKLGDSVGLKLGDAEGLKEGAAEVVGAGVVGLELGDVKEVVKIISIPIRQCRRKRMQSDAERMIHICLHPNCWRED